MKDLTRIAAIAASVFTATIAVADDYPERPIEIIVPYKAGGLTDALARKVGAVMAEVMPNSPEVVIVNKPGGAATIGLTALANSDPDGYTIAFTTSSPVAIQPLYGRVAYTHESFAPISQVIEIPAALNVHKDSDIKTFDEFVAWAKANPGEFTYATTGGLGSGTHIVSEELAVAAGVEMRHIPFEGTAQMSAALTGKQILGTMQSPTLHRGGDARPLIFLTNLKTTDPMYADVPTSADLGIDASAAFFAGFLAPAGTPDDRLAALSDAIDKAMKHESLTGWLGKVKLPISFQGPGEFTAILSSTVENNRVQLKQLGLID